MQRISFFIFLLISTLLYTKINGKAIGETDTNSNSSEDNEKIDNLNTFSDQEEKNLKKRQTETETFQCYKIRHKCLENCDNNSECIEKCYKCPLQSYKNVKIEGDGESFDHTSIINPNHRNITTIIKLTNLINNTNHIDIPTNVNSTNINHIHLYQNHSSNEGGKYGLGYTKDGSCCFVIQPRVCSTSSKGYRCHHKRHKTCGQQCTSRVIHAISRTKCTSSGGCHLNVGYIPQPSKPKCIYIPIWPFVSCGGYYKQSCGGCYDHYGYGIESSYYGHNNGIPNHCSACYDEGFDIGPFYRKGPIFRPFFYHQPPSCYFYGNCHMMMPSFCNMFGCYGNQFIDPVWGFSSNPNYMMSSSPISSYYDENSHYFMNNDNDYDEININDHNDTAISDDWGIQLQKCRVVRSDGSISFKNCTTNNNSYAASPIDPSSNSILLNSYTWPDYDNDNVMYMKNYGIDNKGIKLHQKRHTKQNHKRQLIYDD